MKHGYRADIDGLRAVAVLSVVLYHLSFGIFEGGYLGVDIFFVISGFLITRIIKEEIIAGQFTYANFYERRTRRIFPSVLLTLWLSLVGAALLFSPADLVNFANALMSTMLFVSNFYFWKHIGYFTADVDVKPLLHMWSLSVEEQFYFVWPLMLALILRKTRGKMMYAIIGAVALLSLIAAEYYNGIDANGAFYLLPFRMFEFIIGGAAVWLIGHQPKKHIVNEALTLLGIVMVVVAVLGITSSSPYPSLYSLIPCVGAGLIIYAGEKSRMRWLLSNRVMVYIGLISYQLYLVHWPLYVFYKYRLLESLDTGDKIGLLVASFAMAIPMYHFVDKPLRKVRDKSSLYRFGITAALLAVILAGTTLTIRLDNGWQWRIQEKFRVLMNDPAAFHRQQYGGSGFASRELQTLGAPNTAPSFIIFGDSFAAQYAVGLDRLLKENNKSALALFHHSCVLTPDVAPRTRGAIDEECNGKWDKAKKLMEGNNLPIVVAHSWHTYKDMLADKNHTPLQFASTADYYKFMFGQIEKIRIAKGPNRKMILIGLSPGIGNQQGVTRCFSVPTYIPNKCADHVSMPVSEMREGTEFNRDALQYVAQHPDVTFLNARDVVCDKERCKAIEGGKMYYSDYIHFSVDGSVLFVNHFKDVFLGLSDKSGAPAPAAPPPQKGDAAPVEETAPAPQAPTVPLDDTTLAPAGATPIPIAPIANSPTVYRPVPIAPKPGSIIVNKEPVAPPVKKQVVIEKPAEPAGAKPIPIAPIPGAPVVFKPIPVAPEANPKP